MSASVFEAVVVFVCGLGLGQDDDSGEIFCLDPPFPPWKRVD